MELENLVIGLIGIIFLIVYITQRDKFKLYIRQGIRTQGIVTDFVTEGRYRVCYPIVRFTLNDGDYVSYQSSFGSNPALFKKEEVVELLYLPEKPADFIIVSKKSQQFNIVVLIIGLLAFGYFLFNLIQDLFITGVLK